MFVYFCGKNTSLGVCPHIEQELVGGHLMNPTILYILIINKLEWNHLLLKQIIHRNLALYHAVLGIFCYSVSRNEGEVQNFAGTSGFSEQLTAIDDMFQIGRDS